MPTMMLTTLLLLSSLAHAAPLPASSQQCRCAVMPASTPFFPSLPVSPSSASSQRLVTDSCAALGPQLQAWREAPTDRAADEAARLEKWIAEQDDKVATAATDLLWGKRPIPTAAALVAARTQRSSEGDAKPQGRIVCRTVEVTEEAVGSFEDALYADTTSAEKVRKIEAQESPDAKHSDGCAGKTQKMSFFNQIADAWRRPERHMFALKLVVFVLIVLCMVELGDDVFACIRRRRSARRSSARLSSGEKALYRPDLESIAEEEEDDTQLP
ncbi:methyl-accepting chemotaxis protein [Diplodia corticola]|uniref:Methyl-accepting chemotaxis protein n=1 Tax=Diplodia corticola TaxID=236234 RepID=A0A1J9R7F2_9PEZI|nr:methyl-accepting chemotaxis protein [Diplodia corticola]OJD37462.1 methyl-accepting chemotaxis protein [Diplodia corticola]